MDGVSVCGFGNVIKEHTIAHTPCTEMATQLLVISHPDGHRREIALCLAHLRYIDSKIPGGVNRTTSPMDS